MVKSMGRNAYQSFHILPELYLQWKYYAMGPIKFIKYINFFFYKLNTFRIGDSDHV